MNLSKRDFIKTGMGGAALCAFGSFLNPATVVASPSVIPTSYLRSDVHSFWMKLSYNRRRESRRTRRYVGAALRNIGSLRGDHNGFDFTLCWDQAVHAAFARWIVTREKPGSLFGLSQMLYDDFLHPMLGPRGGRVLFGTLMSLTRGQDGSVLGNNAHAAYLSYRAYALRYKDAARTKEDPGLVEELRQLRAGALKVWQARLLMQINAYANRQASLNPEFELNNAMVDGFEAYVNPDHKGEGRLQARKRGSEVIVSWQGSGQLEEAPAPDGPWTTTRKASPTPYDPRRTGAQFFRTIDKHPDR